MHRLADRHRRLLAGRRVAASSPQGRFAEGAALLDGQVLTETDAWGKHLFHRYDDLWLHVHLGLYGRFHEGAGEPPEPRGALRLRLATDGRWLDLRGPTACELLADPEREALLARLGPDPLQPPTDPAALTRRITRSRARLGALLLDQTVVAGVGNVYRAELCFRHGISPFRTGRELDEETWSRLWSDLTSLMSAGRRSGRIVTTRPEHRERRTGRVRREDAHYVYRRRGEPCRSCATMVQSAVLASRTIYWCPTCQP